jgi:hypothetical protein
MTIEKIRKAPNDISGSQHKIGERGSLQTRRSERLRGTIRWPRSERFSNEVNITVIELMVEEMADGNDWTLLATTFSKLVGLQKFQIHPQEGIIIIQFNQDQVNLTKIQHILRNYGFKLRPVSPSERMEQQIPLPLKSV